MQIFSSYVEPLTAWLQIHPYWALVITGIISFAESLALIGSIVPGSITMTAIGILAGSGIMRLDLTLIAAIIGAVGGDSLSYLLGYVYRDHLENWWLFKKYPHWLVYGKAYFERHGGKSVLIGRFVGPLRSIIPVIAGMLHMEHWRFLAANILSAIGWSLLYVMPGFLIGTASNELSPESATQLFVFVFILLGIIWLFTVGVKWLLIRLQGIMHPYLHKKWTGWRAHSVIGPTLCFFTPIESNHSKTAGLVLACLISFVSLIVLTLCLKFSSLHTLIDQPTFLFLQSLRTHAFDILLIMVQQFISPLSLTILGTSVFCITLYKNDWRSARYWLSLNICTALSILLLQFLIPIAPPETLNQSIPSSYPSILLTFATAQLSALLLYFNKNVRDGMTRFLNMLLSSILLLTSISLLYLGDNWLSDVVAAILAGLSISMIHWLFYRRLPFMLYSSQFVKILATILLVSMGISLTKNYKSSFKEHQIYLAQYVLTEKVWWDQDIPLLPVYRVNRVGRPASIFNLQYAGSLTNFENVLLAQGWQKKNETFFSSFIKRINGQHNAQDSPLLAELYLNRKPSLILSYTSLNPKQTTILRIWRSNFHLQHYDGPIWVGSIRMMNSKNQLISNYDPILKTLSMALPGFSSKIVRLNMNKKNNKKTLLLLIRENQL